MRRSRERGAAGRSFLLLLAVLALLAVVAFLLAERNARQFFLVLEDGALVVKKGMMLPMGRQTFRTDDPGLAAAYAPLRPPPGEKVDEDRAFDDRSALDQALYELLARWARADVASQKPELVERALSWLARADRLPGLSTAQREDLRGLRAETGYHEARQLLDRAAEALRQARERLRLTATSSSPRAGDAGEVLRRIDPMADELWRAARVLAPGPAGAPPREPAPSGAPAPGGPTGGGGSPPDAGGASAPDGGR